MIILTTEFTQNKILDENIEHFFIDVTYNIIPKHFINNKLLTISYYDNKKKLTHTGALILIKYEDKISFQKTFKSFNEIYKINPKICHID